MIRAQKLMCTRKNQNMHTKYAYWNIDWLLLLAHWLLCTIYFPCSWLNWFNHTVPIHKIYSIFQNESGGDGLDSVQVEARMSIFHGNFKSAERMYINQGNPEDAMHMYRTFLQWDDAIRIADVYALPERHQLRYLFL